MPSEAKFEIEELEDGKICVLAKGKTRAGLFNSAMHGLFAAMKPEHHPEGKKEPRTFSVSSDTPEALLVDMLNEALVLSTANREACEELKLDLITDKKAEGSFQGCEVTQFHRPILSALDHQLEIVKDPDTGEWSARICFEPSLEA
ncbi:hypothetical protein GF380_03995 [Candidatus Uhrbacteria bacterium]|nr:hypothetical protein [Candidatus Uhrbacteria bacterium]MBD3284252.1 hypothetical protein [Candidatus Uhrbacteria bacterium]